MVVPTFVQSFVILSLKKSVMGLDSCLEHHVLNQIIVFQLEHLVINMDYGYQIMQKSKLSTFVKKNHNIQIGGFQIYLVFCMIQPFLNGKLTFVICFLSCFIHNSNFQFAFVVPIHFYKMSSSENFSPFLPIYVYINYVELSIEYVCLIIPGTLNKKDPKNQ
jgi:hypothetical protein